MKKIYQILLPLIFIIACNQKDSKQMIGDAEQYFNNGLIKSQENDEFKHDYKAMDELTEKYPSPPVLGKDILEKIFTNHYGKFNVKCEKARVNNSDLIVDLPCKIETPRIEDGEEGLPIFEARIFNEPEWITAYIWNEFYINGRKTDNIPKLDNHPLCFFLDKQFYKDYKIEKVNLVNFPTSCYLVTTFRGDFANKNTIPDSNTLICLVNNQLILEIALLQGQYPLPQKSIDRLKKIINNIVDWKYLKEINLI